MSKERLLQLKARELKETLVKAGIKCDDCFEKEQLVKRMLEASGKSV
jgi:hypothetical protein